MCANFGCQHMPPYFLVKLEYQETLLKAKTTLKHWEALMQQSHLISNDEGTLLLTFPYLHWDMSLSTHHLSYEHLMQWLESSSHSFNNLKCIKWTNHHKNNWSLQCSSTNNSIIGLINEYTTIMVQMAKIKLLSRTNLRHLDGITHHQNITKYEMPNLYTARNLLIINKKLFPNTNLGCIMTLGH